MNAVSLEPLITLRSDQRGGSTLIRLSLTCLNLAEQLVLSRRYPEHMLLQFRIVACFLTLLVSGCSDRLLDVSGQSPAPLTVLEGRIVSSAGHGPILGASILVFPAQATTSPTYVAANASGAFLIAIPPGEFRLRVQSIGYAPQDRNLDSRYLSTAPIQIVLAQRPMELTNCVFILVPDKSEKSTKP